MKPKRLVMIEDMLKAHPNDPFLMYASALEYKKIEQIESSIHMMERLVEEHPDYLATYYQLGKLLEGEGKTERAVVVYKAGRELAKKQQDLKTLSELSEALMILDEEDGEVW